ncbi:MAG: hypothetical protein ABIT58_01890 [Ferruginibacter sp.]
MLQENLNEEIDPKDAENAGTSPDSKKENKDDEDDDEESYDILPSNSAGLEGNDGEQVIDEGEDEDN